MGKLTQAQAIEQLRKALVYCMKAGDRLVLYCGNISPDFKTLFNDSKDFPTEKIFNFQEWHQKDTYKSILREDEDVDTFGNKGWFEMNEKFGIVILQEDDGDEDEKKELMSKIP